MDKRMIRNIFTTCIFLVSAFTAMGAAPEIVLQTCRLEGFPIDFIVRGTENSTLSVDWGDGVCDEHIIHADKTEIKGTIKGRIIRIYNPEITFFDCSGCDIVSLDVTHAGKLKQLYCAKNMLEALDLTGNPDIEMFGCPFNKISYLNIKNCRKLKGMFIQGNSFSSVDLNIFFLELPARASASKNVNLRIAGNPGGRRSNTDIAKQKNWTVDEPGNGTGGQPVTIETLLADGSSVSLELRAAKPSSAMIDWGNGPVRVSLSAKSAIIKGNVYGNYIRIWSDELTFLKCEKMAVSEIDVSHASSLQQLYCAHNELEYIDVSANKKLLRLGAGFNRLKEIDLSGNPYLSGVYIQENLMKAKEIDKLLKQLPTRKSLSENVNLRIVGNPGAGKARIRLASEKNWNIDMAQANEIK